MRVIRYLGIMLLSFCLMSCGHTTKRHATPRYRAQTTQAVVKAPIVTSFGADAHASVSAQTTPGLTNSVSPSELKTLTQTLADKKNLAKGVVYDKSFEPTALVKYWQWPARGRIIGYYSASNKGINIGGHKGDPVYASAFGKVVYAGNGLRGYGNLIIIKHNARYLTAYANNNKLLVDQDAIVKRGQKIAEMGSTGTNRVKLHFEIRQNGSPVNPLSYLPKKG